MSVRQAKNSNRATVLLGVSLTGDKLPPFIIFKGKPGPTGRICREFRNVALNYPKTIEYQVQVKAWMDEITFLDWIERVWRPWCETKVGMTYLILDEFSAHMTRRVQDALADCNTFVDFIIGGYTSKLQTCDVGINKPFKGFMRQQFEAFMVNNAEVKPNRVDMSNWIDFAWKNVSEETIRNTWRRIGIGQPNAPEIEEFQNMIDAVVNMNLDEDEDIFNDAGVAAMEEPVVAESDGDDSEDSDADED